LSEEALQIAEKREAKGKGEKETYTHLNAEFQRIARRNKKAFLSDQCKKIEENNRMGKTRDLFKKIRDTKGTFHAKMGSIKDRNGMDLTEAEDIKRKAFLFLLAILWNSAFKWVYVSFSPLPLASLFSAICKASSDNHFAFLHFFFSCQLLIIDFIWVFGPFS